ncbi:MAG: RHS repeat-associated core domain-containing protein [Burkholderiales bacterium]
MTGSAAFTLAAATAERVRGNRSRYDERASGAWYLNTPHLVADATGTTVWRWDQQEPFGNDAPNGDPGNTGTTFDLPLRLPGQYYDAESGLHYNYFRDYDADTGRYLQADSLGVVIARVVTPSTHLNHLFGYVGQDPLGHLDPYGLCGCPRGIWDQDVGDWQFSLALAGYFSAAKVTYICRSDPRVTCSGRQICFGAGAIFGAGITWNLKGALYGAPSSTQIQGTTGASITGGGGAVVGANFQAPIGAPGGNAGAGIGVGGGLAVINCLNYYVTCSCPKCK